MIEGNRDNVSILLTCHNRRDKTLRCLEKLKEQKGISGISITIYLVDDGSTDGTSEAVKERYPAVNILKGDGTLFWTKGMHKAMEVANDKGFDFYLWLNDDVILYENALKKLLETFNEMNSQDHSGIVIGSVCDPITKKWTYGASQKRFSWYPLRFTPIIPDHQIKEADNFFGNVVLISNEIVKKVGNLDRRFLHGAGDHDYALRAIKMGFKIWVAPNYVGECPQNSTNNSWEDPSLGLVSRYRKLLNIKGIPIKASYYYTKKHGGIFFPFTFLYIYLRLPFIHFYSRIRNWLS